MKKIFTLFFAAVLAISAWGTENTTTITVDNGYNGTSNVAPTSTYYKYNFTQIIYHSSDFGDVKAGNITEISFKYASATAVTRNWDIYLSNTSNTQITSFIAMTSSNKVFSGDVNLQNGWYTIKFDSNFAWDGQSNILVTIDDNTNSFKNSEYIHATSTYNANRKCLVYYKHTSTSDDPNIDATNPTGKTATSDGEIPLVKFTLEEGAFTIPILTSSVSSLDFKDFTAGQADVTQTFTVSGANLTEDVTISTTSTAFTVSPTSINKEDVGTPQTITVTLSATQTTDFADQVITVASGELSKTVTVKGNVYVPEPKDIGSFANLLAETTPQKYIYTYTGTSAKILSINDDYKQITLKDASNKSVQVQLTDAQWEAINPVNGMKVQSFVFTAEIFAGIQPQALCTPITLTFAAPNFTRTMTSTDLATICLKGDVSNFAKLQEQATFYKILYKQEYEGEVYNIVLEEVNTNMEAGKPYIFQPKEPCTMEFYYSATTSYPGNENGLIGTFTKIESAVDNVLVGKYLLSNNMICKAAEYCSLPANRAYINMDQVPTEENATQKVGLRHINLQNADARQQPTNLDQFKAQGLVRKAIVNGKFVILNNGKAFNAIGTEIK